MIKTEAALLEVEKLVNGLEKSVSDQNWSEAIKAAVLSDEKIRAYCDSNMTKTQLLTAVDQAQLSHLHQRNVSLVQSIMTRKQAMQNELQQERKVNRAAVCYAQNSG